MLVSTKELDAVWKSFSSPDMLDSECFFSDLFSSSNSSNFDADARLWMETLVSSDSSDDSISSLMTSRWCSGAFGFALVNNVDCSEVALLGLSEKRTSFCSRCNPRLGTRIGFTVLNWWCSEWLKRKKIINCCQITAFRLSPTFVYWASDRNDF